MTLTRSHGQERGQTAVRPGNAPLSRLSDAPGSRRVYRGRPTDGHPLDHCGHDPARRRSARRGRTLPKTLRSVRDFAPKEWPAETGPQAYSLPLPSSDAARRSSRRTDPRIAKPEHCPLASRQSGRPHPRSLPPPTGDVGVDHDASDIGNSITAADRTPRSGPPPARCRPAAGSQSARRDWHLRHRTPRR